MKFHQAQLLKFYMNFYLFALHLLLSAHCMVAVSANSKFWIVAGRFNPANVSPLCGLNCIKPIGADTKIPFLNRSVGLHKCVFSPLKWDLHLWAYNSSSNALTISQWDADHDEENATFCLESRNITSCKDSIPFDPVSNYPTKLSNCTGERSQQWYLQADGRIRSGLLSAKGEVLYLQSQSLSTEPGGHAPLCLGPPYSGSSEEHLSFTVVPFPTNRTLYSATVMAAAPSPGEDVNLVSNGGFEDMAPGNTSVAPAGNITLYAGNPILCYWSVGPYADNNGELSSVVVTSQWSNPGWKAQQGSNSLLVGGNGLATEATVTQFIRTTPRTEYTLSFFLAGYPKPCLNKTLRLQISPSSNSSAFMVDELFSFNPENISYTNMEWKPIALNFIASSNATNLTFVNPMNAGICAPVIDNVSVIKLKKKHHKTGVVAAAIAIPLAVILAVAAGVIWFVRRPDSKSMMQMISTGRQKRERNDDNHIHIRTYAMWELMEATDNFSTKVGEGGFGAVYRANLGGDQIGAVKRATQKGIRNQQIFKEELSVLLRLNHPNLVNLIGLCFEKGEQILVFEFVPNGSLYDRLHNPSWHSSTPLSWASRMNIMFQIAEALQYLHEQAEPPVLHHDVKSANVLLVDDDHAKLADFGLSKLGHRDNQAAPAPVKGSYGYTDPQYIKTGKPTMKSDVYGFGVVLLEIITGLKSVLDFRTLAEWSEEYRLSQDMQVVMAIIDPTLNPEQIDLDELKLIIDIVNACLKKEGKYRPSMREIVRTLAYKVPIRPLHVRDGDGDETPNTTCYPPNSDSYMTGIASSSVLYVGR